MALSPKTLTEPVDANVPIRISIINKLPTGKYLYSVVKKISLYPILTLPAGFPKAIPSENNIQECSELLNLIIQLKEEEKETKIPALIEKIEEEVRSIREELKSGDSTANDCTASHVLMAEEAVENTYTTISTTYTLDKGEDLEVTITNIDSKEVWKNIYQTSKRGEWLTSYGFSFILDNFDEEDLYYSNGEGSSYTISEKKRNKKMDFVPSVFFTWFPYKDISKNFSTGLTAGLGFDMEAPTVFAGGSIFYNQNISLAVGIVAHKQNVLMGQYSGDQQISEALTEDQLHEKQYTLNPFISLTFRFEDDVFRSED